MGMTIVIILLVVVPMCAITLLGAFAWDALHGWGSHKARVVGGCSIILLISSACLVSILSFIA